MVTVIRKMVMIAQRLVMMVVFINLSTSVRNKYVDELSTYYATGVGKLESFEVKKEVKVWSFFIFLPQPSGRGPWSRLE